ELELVFLEYNQREKRAGTTIPYLIEMPEKKEVIEKWVPDGFENGRLFERLNRRKIRDLIICGYAREICVYETSKSARKFGFGVESSPDLIFGSKDARPSVFKEAILEDFYRTEMKMRTDVEEVIQSHARSSK